MSSEPLSTRRQLELMRDLQRLATTRHQAVEQVLAEHTSGATAAQARYDRRLADTAEDYQERKTTIDAHFETELSSLISRYESTRNKMQQEYHGVRSAAEKNQRQTKEQAAKEQQEAAWHILTVFDASKGRPRQRYDKLVDSLKGRQAELETLTNELQLIHQMRNLGSLSISDLVEASAAEDVPNDETLVDNDQTLVDSVEVAAASETNSTASAKETPEPSSEANENEENPPSDASAENDASLAAATDEAVSDAIEKVKHASTSAREAVQQTYDHAAGKLLEGFVPAGIIAMAIAVGLVVGGLTLGWNAPLTYAVGLGLGVLAVGLVFGVLRSMVKRQAVERARQFATSKQAFYQAVQQTQTIAKARSRREARELVARRDTDLADLGFRIKQRVGDVKQQTLEQLQHVNDVFPAKLGELRQEHEQSLAKIEADRKRELAEATTRRDTSDQQASAELQTELKKLDKKKTEAWQQVRQTWLDGYQQITAAFADMRAQCERLFPNWEATSYADWQKPDHLTPAVQFGEATLKLSDIKQGLPNSEDLVPGTTSITIPTLLTLEEMPSVVMTADGPGRRQGIDFTQALMLRWLTGLPAGKVRFTVLDPIGLGEHFSSFMHLADFDEGLIASRIWSEGRDIDEQLTRITTHMETVIQKYLRSEFDSIHEYNAHAEEVAEPFQVLVVSGFPTNFSDSASRRLINIATGGPRCGVYLIVLIDKQHRLPNEFPMDDLLESAAHLDWDEKQQRMVWRYPAFEQLGLALPSPPSADRMVEVVRGAGQASKDAVRVEVPFRVVAPERDDFWTKSCGDELRVPIGRAGANRLQYVRLGKGTSQHLLVAGKTGSGKSTFLHALITSAAMHFSPDEVQFYLVDFKKGVEFKSYAKHRLPHARVVAIESEREFGLSVLERLDEELKRRGELYRTSGVQNLADFREQHPGVKMPRVLLIVDEFQELFVEDDRLAQDASLLLDRLVRQGRAFGIHVLLGTQTLAGAYSIARSTLGQMAVRVALECSEADSHLILSDERNQAARFLSRPGEAIYNDQNGLTTANEPFQVVWLPDRERADHLADLNEYREETNQQWPEPIVFEGNVAADPARNEKLMQLLEGDRPASTADANIALPAWIGDAVAIKDPTAAIFGRHAGSNLLVCGPQETAALGVLSTAAVSLAAATPDARFVVLDGSRQGDAAAGVWPQVLETLPEGSTRADVAGAPDQLAELASLVEQREQLSSDDLLGETNIYLVLYHAGRFRNLRKTEDDFSFSVDRDKPTTPDKHLAEILKNGPAVGVHVLIWCDGYNVVTRMFDRATMREFAMRVAFQMSAADSSNFMDTPAAANLRQHRALFYSDETGEVEKFRPYGPPSEAWLDSLKRSVGDSV